MTPLLARLASLTATHPNARHLAPVVTCLEGGGGALEQAWSHYLVQVLLEPRATVPVPCEVETTELDEDAIDRKLWLEKKVRAGGPRLRQDLEALLAEAEGEGLEDIARCLGLSVEVLETRMSRRRAVLQAAWARDTEG